MQAFQFKGRNGTFILAIIVISIRYIESGGKRKHLCLLRGKRAKGEVIILCGSEILRSLLRRASILQSASFFPEQLAFLRYCNKCNNHVSYWQICLICAKQMLICLIYVYWVVIDTSSESSAGGIFYNHGAGVGKFERAAPTNDVL